MRVSFEKVAVATDGVIMVLKKLATAGLGVNICMNFMQVYDWNVKWCMW